MKQFLATGIDIVEVNRFKNFNKKSRLAFNTFTEKELSDCFSRANPSASLAARFAAKEAVVKCIGEIRYNKIEIKTQKRGRPAVKLLDRKLAKMYNFTISISHTDRLAVAVCVVWK